MAKSLFAFVLMPFDTTFDDIYKLGIKAAASECSVVVERVDEQIFHDQQILDRIYTQIDIADFIIADMSGMNPNVFYEVGYAHAKNKPCILLTKNASDIPFDLKHRRHIVYGDSISTLKARLVADIKSITQDINKISEDRIKIDLIKTDGDLIKTDYQATAKIILIFHLRNPTTIRSTYIDSIYFYARKGWSIRQDGKDCAPDDSDTKGYSGRYFVHPPTNTLSAGGFAQIKLELGSGPINRLKRRGEV